MSEQKFILSFNTDNYLINIDYDKQYLYRYENIYKNWILNNPNHCFNIGDYIALCDGCDIPLRFNNYQEMSNYMQTKNIHYWFTVYGKEDIKYKICLKCNIVKSNLHFKYNIKNIDKLNKICNECLDKYKIIKTQTRLCLQCKIEKNRICFTKHNKCNECIEKCIIYKTQICSRCNIEKSYSCFTKNKNNLKTGLAYMCKMCNKIKSLYYKNKKSKNIIFNLRKRFL